MENEYAPLMVSIICLMYNHEPYIRQCLEGFVMQKTNFRFEAIVHDDASTDGTADIIREYAEKYPGIIKPVYETENQYSKYDGLLKRILNEYAHGKYVAICEGDDYWTDSLKLQKQVNFLEEHPEYSMCFHSADILFMVQGLNTSFEGDNVETRDYNINELYEKWNVPTSSIVYRNHSIDKFPQMDNRIITTDKIYILQLASVGKVHGISDTMSVYRVHPKSLTRNKSKKKERALAKPFFLKYMLDNFNIADRKKMKIKLAESYYNRSRYEIPFSIVWLSDLSYAMLHYPLFIFKYILKKIKCL